MIPAAVGPRQLPPELAAALEAAREVAERSGHAEIAASLERLAGQETPSRRLILRLFGSHAVMTCQEIDLREHPVDFRLRRSLMSLAFLALQRHRQASKDELIGAIWGESSPEAIRRNFHPTLSELRRTLQDAMGRGTQDLVYFQLGIYRLQEDLPLLVDVELFGDHLKRGRRLLAAGQGEAALAELCSAWQLYAGPLLDGFDEQWVLPRRESLRLEYLEVLRSVAGLARDGALGGTDQPPGQLALDAFRSLLLEDPFDEGIHLEVMRLYARQGRRDLVRRQFIRLQELLKQLNVEPLGSTQEEFHLLMR